MIGARMEMVRAARLKVARASSNFDVNLSHAAGRGGCGFGGGFGFGFGFGGGCVWQYGALPVCPGGHDC